MCRSVISEHRTIDQEEKYNNHQPQGGSQTIYPFMLAKSYMLLNKLEKFGVGGRCIAGERLKKLTRSSLHFFFLVSSMRPFFCVLFEEAKSTEKKEEFLLRQQAGGKNLNLRHHRGNKQPV